MLLVVLCGCSVISSTTTTTRSGTQVSNETLTQLELGKTTKEWLVATLGAPSAITKVGDQTEILKYTSTLTKKQRSGLILVIHTNNETEAKETVYFEFQEGILARYWKTEG